MGRAAVWLDGLERVLVLPFLGWLAARLAVGYWQHGQVANLPLLLSEGLMAVLLLCRRGASTTSVRPRDWALAFAATLAPLLVAPTTGAPLVPPSVGFTLLVMGFLVQVCAKLALGRSFGLVAANRGLKLGGPYRYVRHPMYAGYLLTHVAFLLLNPTPRNLLLYALCDGLQILRLQVEERLLSQDPRYETYRAEVRYRLIPGLF